MQWDGRADGVQQTLGTALLLSYSLHKWEGEVEEGVVPLSLGAVSEPGDTPWGRYHSYMMVTWWSHGGHMVVTQWSHGGHMVVT